MSFSSETKNELAHIMPEKKCCMLAEISGFIRLRGSTYILGGGKFRIKVSLDSPAIARHFIRLLKEYFHVDCSLHVGESEGVRKGRAYYLIIDPDQLSEEILRETGILMIKEGHNYFTDGIYDGIIRTKCCRKSYLRAAFMASGTMSDPESEYHISVSCDTHAKAVDLRKLINTFTDLSPKIVKRKNSENVYVKNAQQVSDILALMGAHSQMLKYENVRVMKDLKNKTNRMANCDSANTDKIVGAAGRQLEHIRKIEQNGGLKRLPENLRIAAMLRLEHPDLSLTDLGQLADPPIGRSGLSKRFAKIEKIAEQL